MKKFICLMALTAVLVTAAAMAAERDTPERSGDKVTLTAGDDIYAGDMVCVWTNSQAYAASDTTNYAVVGRAERTVSAGEKVDVKRGVFRWENKGAFAVKDIGVTCYVWTNGCHSVTTAAVASKDIKAGRIVDVDSSGVWVDSKKTDL